jgi:vacuolar-type H+-ATPase subunit I/STV1
MNTKVCSKCGVEKALCEFHKNKRSPDGFIQKCKLCRKEWSIKNKDKTLAYREKNKKAIAKKHKEYANKNRNKINEYQRDYRTKNKERIRERDRIYYQKNKDKIHKRQNQHYHENPVYRMRVIVSRAVGIALKKQGSTKGGSTFSALPYSPQDLVEHLERQFDDKMNWDNYGSYWDVDHIYPQSLLPYDSLDHPNFQKCWALENLQPLEHIANIRKSNKILDE